jgi:hypothetical protein
MNLYHLSLFPMIRDMNPAESLEYQYFLEHYFNYGELKMPSKSKKQARYVAMLAARGIKWAKEWHAKDVKRNKKRKRK